jgi:hypothetical protein
MTTTLETPDLPTFTIFIVVFFGGAGLNRCIAPLRGVAGDPGCL